MPANFIGPAHLDGVEIETWLLKFDKRGECMSPQTRAALLDRLDGVPDQPVILFSHGWNNEFGEASELYAGFLKQLQSHFHKYASARVDPICVGVIWPSTWLSFDTGPSIAATPPDTATAIGDDAYVADLAAQLEQPGALHRFYALAGEKRLAGAEAEEFAALVAAAVHADSIAPDDGDLSACDAGAIVAGMHALSELDLPAPASGDQLEEGGAVDGAGVAPVREAGWSDALDPRHALRVASVYQMKDRAGTVGWNGVAPLLQDILTHSRAPVHAVGHSFGAKVILSAIAAGAPARAVASVLLLEPAVSHLCFAAEVQGRQSPGGYRAVLGRIEQSLIMTYSACDFPLHGVFHRALRRAADAGDLRIAGGATSAGAPPSMYAALGGYGPRGAGEQLMEPLPEPGTRFDMPLGPIPLAFDGTMYRRIGGHGDVRTAYTAWLLYSQMSR